MIPAIPDFLPDLSAHDNAAMRSCSGCVNAVSVDQESVTSEYVCILKRYERENEWPVCLAIMRSADHVAALRNRPNIMHVLELGSILGISQARVANAPQVSVLVDHLSSRLLESPAHLSSSNSRRLSIPLAICAIVAVCIFSS